MTYVLQTRTVAGALVPYGAEHREYTEERTARRDAAVLASVLDVSVAVVQFSSGAVVATY